MSARVHRRRFLEIAAMTAAGGVFAACAPSAPRTASNPTEAPKPTDAAKPAEAAKPTEAAKPAAAAPTAASAAPTTAAAAPAAPAGNYKEAPQLADLVKAGKLPPVEKRLPDNPR